MEYGKIGKRLEVRSPKQVFYMMEKSRRERETDTGVERNEKLRERAIWIERGRE